MDERKLQTILETVRTGSLSKAAQELHCTQSAVTQIVNAVESELGCRLLQRSHNGVALTSTGEELLPFLIEADTSLSQLKHHAQKLAEGKTIPICIGSFTSVAGTWLSQAIKAYQELHPESAFDIRVGTDVLRGWLLSGEIDLAIGDEMRCGSFHWEPLLHDRYYAVVPEQLIGRDVQSITQEDFVKYPFIMAPRNSLESHLKALPRRSVNISCDDDATLLSMVAQGLGVTAMPRLSLHNVPEHVRVLELTPVAERIIGMALPGTPNRAVSEFAAFLRTFRTPGQEADGSDA